jgi:hypothetical protein
MITEAAGAQEAESAHGSEPVCGRRKGRDVVLCSGAAPLDVTPAGVAEEIS